MMSTYLHSLHKLEEKFPELERDDLAGPAWTRALLQTTTCRLHRVVFMQLVLALSLTAQMADTINHPQHALSCLNIDNSEEHLCDLES